MPKGLDLVYDFRMRIYNFLLVLVTYVVSLPTFAVPYKGHKMVVAAPTHRAIEVAESIMQQGGNVADVAVAVELTLAVTSPYYASLGGGGFAMIKMGREIKALDFREIAPAVTHPNFYATKKARASIDGPLAVGVPGMPAGLWALHQKYGKLKWKQLFEKPIALAQNGFRISGDWVRVTDVSKHRFNFYGKKYFLKKGRMYKPGEILKQPALARALILFRDRGLKGFYDSSVAEDIVSTLKAKDGVMSKRDLREYKVRWLTPIKRNYRGYTFNMMPPPSSSGVVMSSILRLAELTDLHKKKPLSADEFHYLGEIIKLSFRGRSELGDPSFHKNPIKYLTSDKYLKPLAKKITNNGVVDIAPIKEKHLTKESTETTNFTVMDARGNTIVFTATLNGRYGSAVVTKKYGIALNNEMDDFTTIPDKPNMFGLIQGRGNFVEAGKRPLSSMSPTIVTKGRKTVAAAGASGGPRIITSVFQVLYRVIASGFDIDKAIQSPRLHHQFLPKKLFTDKVYFSPDVNELLRKKGHDVEPSWVGRTNGIVLNRDGILDAAHDSRIEGSAGGI